MVSVSKVFQNWKVTLLQQSNLCFRAFVHFHNCELFIVGVLLLSYSGFMFCSMHVGAFNMGGLGISSDSRQGQKNFGQKNFKNYSQRTQRRSNICPELGTSWMGDQLNGSSITWWSSWMGDQLTYGDVIFDLEPSAFKKYSTCWVFQALCNFCIFVFAYYWIE